MRYRIKYYPDGYEYHAYKQNPPTHTEGWEDVAELPEEIKDAEAALLNQPSEIELLKARIEKLEAK